MKRRLRKSHRVDADVGVEDLAGARVDLARSDAAEDRPRGRHPADRRMARVERLEIGVVGLDLRLHRILEAGFLERLVPLEHAVDDRLAILVRDVAVDPEHDRLLGFRQRRRRILFLEAPALDQVDLGRERRVVAVVEALLHEVADAVVGDARAHGLLGQLGDVVVEAEEQAADIGNRRRRRCGESGPGAGWLTRCRA